MQTTAPATDVYSIVETVSEKEGVDCSDLPPLNEVVDPEALEHLFATRSNGIPRGDGHVTFLYCGHTVTVYSDGRVELDE